MLICWSMLFFGVGRRRVFSEHRESLHTDILTKKLSLKGSRIHHDYLHRVNFVITPQNIDYLESLVQNISNPSHPDYGHYLSNKEVADITSHQSAVEKVVDFFHTNSIDIEKKSLNGDYIVARAPVQRWEKLLQTEFHEFTHYHTDHDGKTTPRTVVGAESYTIPTELQGFIIGVLNVLDILPPTPLSLHVKLVEQQPESESAHLRGPSRGFRTMASVIRDGYVRPALLNSVYNITSNIGSNLTSQAIYATSGQTLSLSDLFKFQQTFQIPTRNISKVINGHVSDSACVSSAILCAASNLAAQYMMSVNQNASTTYYYSDSTWDTLLVEIASLANPPKVLTISQLSDEITTSSTAKRAFGNEALRLAAQGVTIIVPAGDNGAAGVRSVCGYYPAFPSTCPYVVTVGGTTGPASSKTEVPCSTSAGGVITTGGGFSTFFPLPSYQAPSVLSYLSSTSALSGFNATGRGYPDVSLLAQYYLVVIGGQTYAVSGTAAPVSLFAGIVGLLNAQRKTRGQGEVGHLNPLLYASERWRRDIAQGDNKCSGGQGFDAKEGWDAVAGLGGVNYGTLLEVVLRDFAPSPAPSPAPSGVPSPVPTQLPSRSPSQTPSLVPSERPSLSPSLSPTLSPSVSPSRAPTVSPSRFPTLSPSRRPTRSPTLSPTSLPTLSPTISPSASPTLSPSSAPSRRPTRAPTIIRTLRPSLSPVAPTPQPQAPSPRPNAFLSLSSAQRGVSKGGKVSRDKEREKERGRVKVVTPRPVRGGREQGQLARRYGYKHYEVNVI